MDPGTPRNPEPALVPPKRALMPPELALAPLEFDQGSQGNQVVNYQGAQGMPN